MESADSENTTKSPLSWWLVLGMTIILALLSFWTWQKWDAVWIERSEAFFPPEWQNEDLDTLAWAFPIYRSNDTYQWVHVADALTEGNHIPLYHRFDEGPPDGRPNRWHSGLAYLLSAGGTVVAAVQDWPTQQGIHHLAHWLGVVFQLGAILIGACLVGRLAGRNAALLFAGLYFFNAAIIWDFAFSRLDHEAVFQFFVLLHLLGLAGMVSESTKSKHTWALLAGISAGFCWWISATIMVALSALATLGLAAECYRGRHDPAKVELAKSIALWGVSAAGMILFFCLLDGRLSLVPSIATIHPLFILVQIGAALFCMAPLLQTKAKRASALAIALVLGLSPIVWLVKFQEQAHPWLNPMMRRLHEHIVEFQSPFTNGLWGQPETIQAIIIGLIALLALRQLNRPRARLFAPLIAGLLLLALLQTRWLGLLAAVSACGLCLQLKRPQMPAILYLSLGLLLLSIGTWAHKWTTIKADPARIFVTDMMLQVGARDINLNLQRLAGEKPIHVAMPYAFATTAALFPEVRPLGTFYWENQQGIKESANFFAGVETDAPIDYVVVQGGRQGAPFAKLTNWVALADDQAKTIEQSPAWKLASQAQPRDGWQEVPFKGTFGLEQFSVRIYRSLTDSPNQPLTN